MLRNMFQGRDHLPIPPRKRRAHPTRASLGLCRRCRTANELNIAHDCVLLHRGYPLPFLPVCRKAEEGQVGELNLDGFSAAGTLVCGAGALSVRTASIPRRQGEGDGGV
jgi:hypothetical protein